MPTSAEILAGLTSIANHAARVSIGWHVVVAIILVALFMGWRPSRAMAGAFLGVPLASVAVFAMAYGNPFNAAVFTVGTITLFALALGGLQTPVQPGPWWARAMGFAMLAFAWFYPHFLTGSPVRYLYAAPMGVIPCPSLAMVIGFALLGGGVGPRAWRLTLAGLGLLFGLFGVARLGVMLDLGLLAGAATLASAAWRPRTARVGRQIPPAAA